MMARMMNQQHLVELRVDPPVVEVKHEEEEDGHEITNFILKVWGMVENPDYNHLISWTSDGKSFTIHNHHAFSQQVLPKFFKHNKFNSFVRQLNLYGFRKMTRLLQGTLSKAFQVEPIEFWHANFRRGHPELLHLLQRKSPQHKDFTKSEDLSQVLSSVHELRGRHEGIITDITSLKHENDMLQKEVVQLRRKSRQQEHVLNKVIHFIAHMIYQGRLPGAMKRKRQALSIMPADEGPAQKIQRQSATSPATIGDIVDFTGVRMLDQDGDNDQQLFESQLSPTSVLSGDYSLPSASVASSLPTEYTSLEDLSSVASGSQRDLGMQNTLELLEPLSSGLSPTGTLDGNSYKMPDIGVGNDVHEITHDSHIGILDKMNNHQSDIDALHGQMTSQLNIDPELLSGFISCKNTVCPNYDCDDTSRLLELISSVDVGNSQDSMALVQAGHSSPFDIEELLKRDDDEDTQQDDV
ncbi:heat shock factor protein 4-like isoform X2 [Dysidea avara]|uniref:heat shock factor protein 4-like isoform X2 n=1 Tax=Dysidea avara TaxID=196820 RepID=UPI0033269116